MIESLGNSGDYSSRQKQLPTTYRLFNVVYNKRTVAHSFSVVVSRRSFDGLFLQPHVCIFSGNFSEGHTTTSVHSAQARSLLGTLLACSYFYSSPAGLLGRQRVDIGYEKLKLTSGRVTMATTS